MRLSRDGGVLTALHLATMWQISVRRDKEEEMSAKTRMRPDRVTTAPTGAFVKCTLLPVRQTELSAEQLASAWGGQGDPGFNTTTDMLMTETGNRVATETTQNPYGAPIGDPRPLAQLYMDTYSALAGAADWIGDVVSEGWASLTSGQGESGGGYAPCNCR